MEITYPAQKVCGYHFGKREIFRGVYIFGEGEASPETLVKGAFEATNATCKALG